MFYDKKKSFFDTISCEATEKSKGHQNRNNRDRNAEFKLNKETFGVASNRGRGGYYNRRGGYGQGNRGYHQGYGGGGYRGGYGGRGGYNNQVRNS